MMTLVSRRLIRQNGERDVISYIGADFGAFFLVGADAATDFACKLTLCRFQYAKTIALKDYRL